MKSDYETTTETPPLREKTVAEILVEYIEEGQRLEAQRRIIALRGRPAALPWRHYNEKIIEGSGGRPVEVINEVNH